MAKDKAEDKVCESPLREVVEHVLHKARGTRDLAHKLEALLDDKGALSPGGGEGCAGDKADACPNDLQYLLAEALRALDHAHTALHDTIARVNL